MVPASKRLKLSAMPSLFAAPRSFTESGDEGRGGVVGGEGAASGQYQSLREENNAHLKHDREVQARCQASAAAKKAEMERAGAGPVGRGAPLTVRPTGGIRFPNASAADVKLTERHMTIPDVLASPAAYKSTFVAALEEDINMKLQESAAGLYKALREISGARKGTLVVCKCNPQKTASCSVVRKDGPNQNRPFFNCRQCNFFQWADTAKQGSQNSPSLAEEAKVIDMSTPPNLAILRQRQQAVYSCQVISTDRKDFQQINARKKAGQADAGSKRETRICIKMTEQQHGKVLGCNKDDMWIVSSSPFFSEDRTATTVIATSAWYGPDGDNNIELKPLVGHLSGLKNRNVCYAFKGPNISSELDMLENLSTFSPPEVPLMPALLSGATRSWRMALATFQSPRALLIAFRPLFRVKQMHCFGGLTGRIVQGVARYVEGAAAAKSGKHVVWNRRRRLAKVGAGCSFTLQPE